MKKKAAILLLFLVLFSQIISFSASADELTNETHRIEISFVQDKLSVTEVITIAPTSNQYIQNIDFWIMNNAEEVKIIVKGTSVTATQIGNIYTINLSLMNIEINSSPQIRLTYKLDKSIKQFSKHLTSNTSNLQIIFNGETLCSSNNLIKESSFSLLLYQPTETPVNTYIIAIFIAIIVLLILLSIYLNRKRKTTKVKKIAVESEELLATKKALLMELLKDIEKQHRAKDISDDTYNKLKEHYKSEAVDVMKKLEDIK